MDVTVTGSDFEVGDQVVISIGDVAQAPIAPSIISLTQLAFLMPAQAMGTQSVNVVVESPAGLGSNVLVVNLKAPVEPTQAGEGALEILGIYPVPNPNPDRFAVDLAGPADSLNVEIYSKAFVLALKFSVPALSAGWNPVPLPPTWGGLASGLYYVRVLVLRGASTSAPGSTKVFILK
ncbi:MAG: IPT/TIG domain-containing protein [bacterium]